MCESGHAGVLIEGRAVKTEAHILRIQFLLLTPGERDREFIYSLCCQRICQQLCHLSQFRHSQTS